MKAAISHYYFSIPAHAKEQYSYNEVTVVKTSTQEQKI